MALQRPNRGLLLALVATILCICCHTSHAATEKSAVRSSADLTNFHAPSLDGLYGGSDDDDPDEETLQAQIKVDKALMETGDNSMEQELSELIASSEIGLHSAKSSRTAKKDSMKQKLKGNSGKDSVTANVKTLDEQLNDDVKALMGISDKEVQKVDTNLQQLSAQLDFGGQAFGVPSSAGGDILLELDSVAPRYNRKVAPELPNPYPFPEELAPEAEEAKLASLLTVTITEPDPVFPGRFRKRTIPLSQLNPNQTISLAPSAAMANNSLVAGAVNSTQQQQPPLPPPPLPSYIPPWTPGVSNLTREERVLLAQSFEEIASTPARPGAQPLVTRGELAAGNHTWLSLEAEEARQAVVAKDEILANKTSSLLMEHFEEAPFEVRQCLSRPAGCSCFRCCNMLCAAWRSSLHTRDEKKAHRHCVKTCFFNANAEPEGTTKQWPSLCRKCHVKSRYRLLLEKSLKQRVNVTVVASNSTQGANSTQTQLHAPAQVAPSVKIV